jgi:hypothetical protein
MGAFEAGTAANTPPTLSNITDKTTNINIPTGPISFTIGDAQTPPGGLTVSGGSSNQTLVPNGNIVFGGSGTNRTVTITPAAGQSGNTTITISVSDGVATTSDSFGLTVNLDGALPTYQLYLPIVLRP